MIIRYVLALQALRKAGVIAVNGRLRQESLDVEDLRFHVLLDRRLRGGRNLRKFEAHEYARHDVRDAGGGLYDNGLAGSAAGQHEFQLESIFGCALLLAADQQPRDADVFRLTVINLETGAALYRSA